jgi:hypothetical protein
MGGDEGRSKHLGNETRSKAADTDSKDDFRRIKKDEFEDELGSLVEGP